jgi:hypothetical protein
VVFSQFELAAGLAQGLDFDLLLIRSPDTTIEANAPILRMCYDVSTLSDLVVSRSRPPKQDRLARNIPSPYSVAAP